MPVAEEWLPIWSHPGYAVSDEGRVRSLDKVIVVRGAWYPIRGQLLVPSTQQNGHRIVKLGRGCVRYVYHLVADEFLGEAPRGHRLFHANDDITDNAAGNLIYRKSGGRYRATAATT